MTEQGAPDEPGTLSFLATAMEGAGALVRHFASFLRVAAIPVGLLLLFWAYIYPYVSLLTLQLFFVGEATLAGNITAAAKMLYSGAVMTLFGMPWLRLLLKVPQRRPLWRPDWTRQHWPFLLYSLLLLFTFMAVSQALFELARHWPEIYLPHSGPWTLALRFVADYVICCFGLAFCFAATGQRGGLLRAWRITSGLAALKMAVVIAMVTIGLHAAGGFVVTAARSLTDAAGLPDVLPLVPGFLVEYAVHAARLGVFAFAFRRLTGWPHRAQEKTLAAFD